MTPKITDLADISDIMELRFQPTMNAGSKHLMTSVELDKSIAKAQRRFDENPRGLNLQAALKRLLDEREKRLTEQATDRANRLRERISWELTLEKREKMRAERPFMGGALPIRY